MAPTIRRSQIIKELSELSRNGWANARSGDYTALEAELREIDNKERSK